MNNVSWTYFVVFFLSANVFISNFKPVNVCDTHMADLRLKLRRILLAWTSCWVKNWDASGLRHHDFKLTQLWCIIFYVSVIVWVSNIHKNLVVLIASDMCPNNHISSELQTQFFQLHVWWLVGFNTRASARIYLSSWHKCRKLNAGMWTICYINYIWICLINIH